MVVLFSLATAMVCGMAMSPYAGKETGETALLRQLFEQLDEGDTDATRYTKDDLAELYQERWLAELDLRALKCSLGMDILRCKSPEMVRKEIWVCLLAYNLIRRVMLQAASQSDLSPRQLSFTAAIQKIAACWMTLPILGVSKVKIIAIHLTGLLEHHVRDRPDRVEPRAVKRRPKHQKFLTNPRAQAQAELLADNSV